MTNSKASLIKKSFICSLKRHFYHFTHHAIIMLGNLYAPVGAYGDAASTCFAFHHVNNTDISVFHLFKMAGVEGAGGNTVSATRAGFGNNPGVT